MHFAGSEAEKAKAIYEDSQMCGKGAFLTNFSRRNLS
jgi:hypothetical protein